MLEEKKPRFVDGPLNGQFVPAGNRPSLSEVQTVDNHIYKRYEDGDFHFMLTKHPLRLPEMYDQMDETELSLMADKFNMQKLASLLSRIDEHLDCNGLTLTKRWQHETLRLRGEIVAAIGELRGQEQGGDSDVAALQEAAGKAPQADDAEVASPHGGYVGVCGVEDCPHCKTQKDFQGETAHWDGEVDLDIFGRPITELITKHAAPVGDGCCECGPQEDQGKQLKDSDPKRPQTWRDRPPML